MNYQESIPNLIGLLGVSLILLAYVLLQVKIWKPDSLKFSFYNLIGSVCILFSLFFNWNLSSVVIEISWMIVSTYQIIHIIRNTYRKKTPLSRIDLRKNRDQNFTALSPLQNTHLLKELGSGWELIDGSYLKKTWIFDSYQKSIEFVRRVSEMAEKNNHHPNFNVEYKKITVTLWTHNINALTKADYVMASKISSNYT
jgi:4a-hydroxytetrahydrobiopterin dehydratase